METREEAARKARQARAKAIEPAAAFYDKEKIAIFKDTLSGILKTNIEMDDSDAYLIISEMRVGENIPRLFDRLMASKQITRDGNKLKFEPAPAPDVGYKILNPPTQ